MCLADQWGLTLAPFKKRYGLSDPSRYTITVVPFLQRVASIYCALKAVDHLTFRRQLDPFSSVHDRHLTLPTLVSYFSDAVCKLAWQKTVDQATCFDFDAASLKAAEMLLYAEALT